MTCLEILVLLFAFASALASSLRNAQHNDKHLTIKGAVHKSDDPHEQKEKINAKGYVITPRIVGGVTAAKDEYPFFVRVDHNLYPACGGSLVAPDMVLTAGHCKTEAIQDLSVVVNGFHDNSNFEPDQHPRPVVEAIRHPEYDTTKYYNDVMLLRLNESVYDVPYVELNKDVDLPKVGEQVTVIGLGALEESGGYPDMLQEVDLGVVDPEMCTNSYEQVGLYPIYEDIQLCASTITNAPQDACQGDSGGPLLNKLGIQVGVISFGLGCARDGFPGVYCRTAVRKKENWVIETLCNMTQTSDLDEWCGRGTLSMGIQQESSSTVEPALQLSLHVKGATPSPSISPTQKASSKPSPVIAAETKTDTEGTQQELNANTTLDLDLCTDEPDAIFKVFNETESDCRWLRSSHEAIRQWSCREGGVAWNQCRATCGRCPAVSRSG